MTLCALLGAGLVMAAPTVTFVDEGVRVPSGGGPPQARLEPVRLFALRDEVVAFQVVVTAGEAPVREVAVTVEDAAGLSVALFEAVFAHVERASGSPWGGSLGWREGAGPRGDVTGWFADALVPVEAVVRPLDVPSGQSRVVWVDVWVPPDTTAGVLRPRVRVRAGRERLAEVVVELDVRPSLMPPLPVRTALFYNNAQLRDRMGEAGLRSTEAQLWRLLRAHRVSPLHDALDAAEVRRRRAALDGSFYTEAAGYRGPAAGVGDGALSLGAYGGLGAPTPERVAAVREMVGVTREAGLRRGLQLFVYAIDEQCGHAWGQGWVDALRDLEVDVGWTCSEPAATQPVDLVIKLASAYDAGERAPGKRIWVYNGVRPYTGAFSADVPLTDLRANGWIAALAGVERWFYWNATYWNGWNPGGRGPRDPFAQPETFHNQHGEWGVGEGVLLYPGRQPAFPSSDFATDAVFPSMRLKAWRRGIQDAGYLELARAVDRAAAERVARSLLPRVFQEARAGEAPSWPTAPARWVTARRALLDIIEHGRGPAPEPTPDPEPPAGCAGGCGCGSTGAGAWWVLLPWGRRRTAPVRSARCGSCRTAPGCGPRTRPRGGRPGCSRSRSSPGRAGSACSRRSGCGPGSSGPRRSRPRAG